MTAEVKPLNECQAAITLYIRENNLKFTYARKTLIELIGEFNEGFNVKQLTQKAEKRVITETTVYNFLRLCKKAEVVELSPAYYSFKVIDAEIVK